MLSEDDTGVTRDGASRRDEAREVLRRVWGYPEFRPGQGEIIDAVFAGQDVLAIMPTGGGKSLCYQLPALMGDGLTLVVSPLIALMHDQVAALRAAGVEAGALTSASAPEETARTWDGLRSGALKLLYCAPERLALEATADRLAQGPTRAYGRVKALFDGSWDSDLATQLDAETDAIASIGLTRDFQEGIKAFSQKRPAWFQGS